jgi:hypothetical protein
MHIIDTASSDAYHHTGPCILTEEGSERYYGVILGLLRGVDELFAVLVLYPA